MVKARHDILVAVLVAGLCHLWFSPALGGFLGTTFIYFITVYRWERFVKQQHPSDKTDRFAQAVGFCMLASILSDVLSAISSSQNIALIVLSGVLLYVANLTASRWANTTWSGKPPQK